MPSKLFTPFRVGELELPNRVVMSPMTRSRATDNVPNELMATYYAQRAEAGLIITEGTSPSPNGLGYPRIPGIFNNTQVDGWRQVTDAVHKAGGRIFLQLMHTGRVGHPDNLPGGARVLGPSAIAAPGQMYTDKSGLQNHPVPEVMTERDIADAIEEYGAAAKNAMAAGFDGVELHGANGYLIEQFLNQASNRREDGYAGNSVVGRTRFALEVAARVTQAIGADRVGMRLSPYGVFNGSTADPDTDAVYLRLADELSTIGLAALHLVDHSSMGAPPVKDELKQELRRRFRGVFIVSGGYDRERADADLDNGRGDLVAFGRPFISNPRLVSKLARSAELLAPDASTFYTPGPKGYTDYPVEG